jgi:type I restriction enzyme S subunit
LKDLLSAPLINGRSVVTRDAGFPVLRLTAIKPAGVDIAEHKGGDWTEDQARPFLVAEGDFLVSRGNGSLGLVGRGALVPYLTTAVAFPDTMIRVRVDPNLISSAYLSRIWNSPIVRNQIVESVRTTSGIYKLNQHTLKEICLPIPPLEEQSRLVRLLDQVDTLRYKRRVAVALLDDLIQSTFLEMFGNPTHNGTGWPAATLGEIAAEFRYGTSNKAGSTGYPALRIPNVLSGSLDVADIKTVEVTKKELERLRLCHGDLLFVRTNGNPDYIGRCAVFTRDAVASSGFSEDEFIYASYIIRARVDKAVSDPLYIREHLRLPTCRKALREKAKTSAGQFNINIQGLEGISLMIPPLDLQQDFARKVARVEQHKSIHLTHLAQLDALFDSLQDRAFCGQL